MAILGIQKHYLAVLLGLVLVIGVFQVDVEGKKCLEDSCCNMPGNCRKSADGDKSVNGTEIADIVTDDFFRGIVNQCPSECAGKEFYTRAAFLKAAKAFPEFGKGDSVDDTKREIASLFAHFSHETTRQLTGSTLTISIGQCPHFCYTEEIDGASKNYCDKSDKENACVPGKKYHGRGPIQLSWNFNYGPAGKDLGFDGLNNPDIVAKDPVISFKTGLRFWMNQCHSLVASKKGFGATIRAINGDLECNGANPEFVGDRAKYYTDYCKQLDVDPGDKIRC